jgi:pre-mRNA-processing factor 19
MQSAIATLEIYNTEINGLSFSENGYYLATCATRDNCVKIVDLRKSEIVRKIEMPENNYEVKSVKFDHSGTYLGIVGSSVNMYQVKNNQLFCQFQDHTDLVTDIGFGKDCEYIVTSSLDRNLNLYK